MAYRAELAIRVDDPGAASRAISRAREIPLSDGERDRLVEALASIHDLKAQGPPEPRAPGV